MNNHNANIDNSLLIDEYSKCLFDSNVKESCLKFRTNDMNAPEDYLEVEKKWKPGMNVRAIYSKDKEYYEAVIKTIINDQRAVVRFIGYENEEEVDLNRLQYSKGEKSIRIQMENAISEQELTDGENSESCKEEMEWRVGMPCRALYDENNVIYEATVLEVDEKTRTALLKMTGFNKNFVARFEEMYESIPEYRIKQENLARKIANENLKFEQSIKQENISMVNDSQKSTESVNIENEKRNISSDKKNEIRASSSDNTNQTKKNTVLSNSLKTDENVDSSHPESKFSTSPCFTSKCQTMVHPETESEALACFVSSNYLSGYYAGYYDCMRKFKDKRKSEK